MTEINELTFFGIKFTKNTQVDYEKGDPIINSIFKQYDENLNGRFDNNEWLNFSNFVQNINAKMQENTKVNSNVIGYYDKKIAKLEKQFIKIGQKFEKLDLDAYNTLLEFEEKHSCINRCACKNKEDIPKNAYKYDASLFEIGIYDEEKQSFSGECYKFGYIEGLDQLTKEERKEYLALLNKACNVAKKHQQYEQELDSLNKEYDKYTALKDLADSGNLETVGSEEYENQMYERYVNIRNTSNPFYKQIKDLEQKRDTLWLKYPRTENDDRQIEQYNIQIRQLEEASRQWSIRYSNNDIDNNYGNILNTNSNNSLTAQDNTNLSENSSVITSYSDKNVSFNNSIELSNTVSFDKNHGIESSLNTNTMFSYKRGSLVFDTATTLSATASYLYDDSDKNNISLSNIGQSFNLRKDDLYINGQGTLSENLINGNISAGYKFGSTSINGTGTISSSDGATYQQYGININQSIGKINTSAGILTDTNSLTYQISASSDFSGNINKNTTYSLTPSVSAQYNNGANSYGATQNLTASLQYNNNGNNYNINVMNCLSETFYNDIKAQINNTLTITGSATYKNWTGQLNYTNTYFAGDSSNTIGGSVSYNNKNTSFGLSFSHSDLPAGDQNMLTASAKLRF